jgi:hypothetical protein
MSLANREFFGRDLSWVARVSTFVSHIDHVFCRHEFVRRFGRERLWLECTRCGHETPGVSVRREGIITVTPRSTYRGDRLLTALTASERHT